MAAIIERVITIELPFRQVMDRDAVFTIATIESQGRRDRVAVVISGPSQIGFADSKQTHRMPQAEVEEARAWFALIELAHRPRNDLEQVSPPVLPEIRVTIPTGPGPRGEWTIESIRSFAADRLRDYLIRRDPSYWRATRKPQVIEYFHSTPSFAEGQHRKFLRLIERADQRFDKLRSQSRDEIAKRDFGRWVIAHQLVPELNDAFPLTALPDILRITKGSEVGWPIGVVQSRMDAAPVPWDDGLEAWVISRVMHPSLDYWYAKPTGFFYQTRAFEEDLELAEGSQLFDVTLPIWRMGEAILHAGRMARAYGAANGYSRVYARYDGLVGRTLLSRRPEIDVPDKYMARANSWSNEINVPTGDLSVEALAELTYGLLGGLYKQFDHFQLPRKTYLGELRRMMKKAV